MAKSLNETIQAYLWIVTSLSVPTLKSFMHSEDLFKDYMGIDCAQTETPTRYKLIKCVWGVVRR